MVRAAILGTGSVAPSRAVTNRDLEDRMDTSDAWITQRTGIRERRIGLPTEKWSDFMLPACRIALETAGVGPEEIGLIVAGTMTADMRMPSGGCVLQEGLGAVNAAAFDVSSACSGFVYGLTIADRFIRAEPDLKVLVAGGDMLSPWIDWGDRSTAVLFGDGGGAAVLAASDDPDRGILSSRIRSDGTLGRLLTIAGDGSQLAFGDKPEMGNRKIRMIGAELFKVAVRSMETVCGEVLAEAGLTDEDVDIVVPHQANLRMIQALADRFGVSMDRVFVNVDRYGNTSAGTIPLALDEAVRAGRVRRGDVVLMPVFGGGLTWGATLVRW